MLNKQAILAIFALVAQQGYAWIEFSAEGYCADKLTVLTQNDSYLIWGVQQLYESSFWETKLCWSQDLDEYTKYWFDFLVRNAEGVEETIYVQYEVQDFEYEGFVWSEAQLYCEYTGNSFDFQCDN